MIRSDARKSLASDLVHRLDLSPGVAGTERLVANKSGTVPTARLAPGRAVFAIPRHRGPSSSEWRRTDLRASFRRRTSQACDVFIRWEENEQA
ncbi:MAG: hypothetical protein DME48_05730 [Verrucomicrobia bacterium]|nr:MAG: hypothetical protein DME48_05730 [Verrucomicrobiota bacterium]